jgi:geranylgeranyl pyrophosphate synthase
MWKSLRTARSSLGYGPLLRMARSLFEPAELRRLLAAGPGGGAAGGHVAEGDAVSRAEAISWAWLAGSGKRFRPFITLASYAAIGQPPGGAAETESIPDAVKAVALAMEVLHKASLVHDDIEDEDECRYGALTIHARHGVPLAVNCGDHLVGLGYGLVAAQATALGAACTCDLLARLAEAHVQLCRGQGAELLLTRERRCPRPAEVLAVYALKTAPTFVVAMCAGMRMAGPLGDDGERVAMFCRHLGVGYQILDDLDDLRLELVKEQPLGQDFLRRRPTVLRALAAEAGADGRLEHLLEHAAEFQTADLVEQVRQVYQQSGVLRQARRLVGDCRRRALDMVAAVEAPALGELMLFLLEAILGVEEFQAGDDSH